MNEQTKAIIDRARALLASATATPWRKGTVASVVADAPVPEMLGSDELRFYGGHLVGESIVERNADAIVFAGGAERASGRGRAAGGADGECQGGPVKRTLGFDPARPHVYVTRCVRCGDETTVWVAFMLWTDACRRHRCARCLAQLRRPR